MLILITMFVRFDYVSQGGFFIWGCWVGGEYWGDGIGGWGLDGEQRGWDGGRRGLLAWLIRFLYSRIIIMTNTDM